LISCYANCAPKKRVKRIVSLSLHGETNAARPPAKITQAAGRVCLVGLLLRSRGLRYTLEHRPAGTRYALPDTVKIFCGFGLPIVAQHEDNS
jgi:hypothetical protein